jgi:hypothetical protein
MAKDDADTLRKKREKLEAELAVLRDQERTAAEKCHAIAGRAALDHAAKNPEFKKVLLRALDQELVKGRERKLFGLPLVGQAATPEAAATEAAATEGRESTP